MRALRDDYVGAIVASWLFGLATSDNNGRFSRLAFWLAALGGVVVGARAVLAARSRGASTTVLGRHGASFVLLLLASMPITAFFDKLILPQPVVGAFWVGRAAELVSLALLASYLPFLDGARREDERTKTLRFAAFGVLLLAAGVAAVRVSPSPDIDVWTIQVKATEYLLAGKNPYQWVAIPTSDLADDFTVVYNYPPISIYLALLGRLLGGDPRYAILLVMFATGFALRSIARRGGPAPSLVEDAPALAYWLWPPLLMILDRAWIDPLQVMLLAVTLALHGAKRTTAAALVLGVAISSKQSMFWVVPLAFVLFRFDLRRWIVLGAGALLPLLPFLVWDAARLKHNLFDFMAGLGPRHDGLCFTAWVHHTFGAAFPHQIGFLLGAVAVAAALLREPREAGDRAREAAVTFARALLVTYFFFFFFNRWMFANYYCTVSGFGALTAAAAAGATRTSET